MNTVSRMPTETRGELLRGLLGPSVRGAFFVALVTGAAYPLATTAVAQLLMPKEASGSLIEQEGRILGSSLIGQDFTSAHYFHPRPSATKAVTTEGSNTSQPYNAAASLGSNLGPTSAALFKDVQERAKAYRARHGLADTDAVPVDALTASASGLDPHISVANARIQAGRVAQARQLPPVEVLALVEQHTAGRWLGVFGELRVHVLQLNLALDALAPVQTAARSKPDAGEAHEH